MKGKKKCKILKEIRKQIAEQNDIAYVTSECKHQGDCRGTCPKCEAEVRYLEEELKKRSLAGKKVAIAGVAAAMVVSASGCGLEDLLNIGTTAGAMEPESQTEVSLQGDVAVSKTESPELEFTQSEGEIDLDESSEWETMGVEPAESDEMVDGEMPYPDESDEEESGRELGGAVPVPEDSSEEESEWELMGEPLE